MDGLVEMILIGNEDSKFAKTSEATNDDTVNDDNDDVALFREEINSSTEEIHFSNEDNDNENDAIRTSPIKLLLMRTPWYIIGLVVLVTGVVLSQYHIHLPYEAECDDTYNDNFTNSTTTDPITNGSINYTVSY